MVEIEVSLSYRTLLFKYNIYEKIINYNKSPFKSDNLFFNHLNQTAFL